jgi:hypothetical protein
MREPIRVGMPRVAMMSFTPTGIPKSGRSARMPPRALLGLGHGAGSVEPFPCLDAPLLRGNARGAGFDQLLDGGAALAIGAKHFLQTEAKEIH